MCCMSPPGVVGALNCVGVAVGKPRLATAVPDGLLLLSKACAWPICSGVKLFIQLGKAPAGTPAGKAVFSAVVDAPAVGDVVSVGVPPMPPPISEALPGQDHPANRSASPPPG